MTATAIRIIVGASLLVGLFLAAFYGPRASAAEPETAGPRWQLWIARPGEEWAPLVSKKGKPALLLTSPTACNLDLSSQANVEPSGTLLACRRIDRSVQR